jgi:rhodanese-related sulfurtransferase
MPVSEINAAAFADLVKEGKAEHVLDVRTCVECRSKSLDAPCIRIPLHELDAGAFMRDHAPSLGGRPLYILCHSGGRARKAAETLSAAGLNAVIVTGGLEACSSCGAPMKQGKAMSLERQVRIAAGGIVLLGVVLGYTVSGVFFALSGLVGAGLIFAGVTDKCGLALLLARAPWNADKTDKAIQESLHKFSQKGA